MPKRIGWKCGPEGAGWVRRLFPFAQAFVTVSCHYRTGRSELLGDITECFAAFIFFSRSLLSTLINPPFLSLPSHCQGRRSKYTISEMADIQPNKNDGVKHESEHANQSRMDNITNPRDKNADLSAAWLETYTGERFEITDEDSNEVRNQVSTCSLRSSGS